MIKFAKFVHRFGYLFMGFCADTAIGSIYLHQWSNACLYLSAVVFWMAAIHYARLTLIRSGELQNEEQE